MGWTCSACTFDNSQTATCCDICATPRSTLPNLSKECSTPELKRVRDADSSSETNATKASSAEKNKKPRTIGLFPMFRPRESKNPYSDRVNGVKVPEKWRVYKSTLLVWESQNLTLGSQKVAAFDFDGCLCTNNFASSGFALPRDLAYTSVPERLRALHENGWRIAILTNEANIGRFKDSGAIERAVLRKTSKLETFAKFVGVPLQILVASAYDSFRKPSSKDQQNGKGGGTAMWSYLCDDPDNTGFETPVLELSFFVGDSAGRPGDTSDADINFATMAGLQFFTQDDFFFSGTPVSKTVSRSIQLPWVDHNEKPASQSSMTEVSSPPPPTKIVYPLLRPRTLVIMVGLQGAGKTTTANRVVSHVGGDRCVRFSQDALGSRQRVERAIQDAFRGGKSVVIVDRTNVSREQRRIWTLLAKEQRAVVVAAELRCSIADCVNRLIRRTEHEGRRDFPSGEENRAKVTGIVNSFARQFQSIDPVAEEIDTHVECSRTVQPLLDALLDRSSEQGIVNNSHSAESSAVQRSESQRSTTSTISETREHGELARTDTQRMQNIQLRFPAISTDDFKVDPKAALLVLFKQIEEWTLRIKHPGVRWILVLEEYSAAYNVHKEAMLEYEKPLDSRFQIVLASTLIPPIPPPAPVASSSDKQVAGNESGSALGNSPIPSIAASSSNSIGNGTQTEPNNMCSVNDSIHEDEVIAIGVGCNHLFRAGGDKLNVQLHRAIGREPSLQHLTREQLDEEGQVARVGAAYAVLLPSSIQAAVNGAKCIIHVLGPNMNSNRADCLESKETALKLLSESYNSLFSCFWNLFGVGLSDANQTVHDPESAELGSKLLQQDTSKNTTTTHSNESTIPSVLRYRYNSVQDLSDITYKPAQQPPPNSGNWSKALHAYLDVKGISDQVKGNVYLSDNDRNAVIVYDAFPKAKCHLLVMATLTNSECNVDRVSNLQKCHLKGLRDLFSLSQLVTKRLCQEFPGSQFRIGFHGVPSLTPMHIHIISQDFDSDTMKNKKHWNSFTNNDFFIDCERVINELERHGKVESAKDSLKLDTLLKQSLMCHRCDTPLQNIPKLKAHIRSCDVPLTSKENRVIYE